jgi:hypothetical protein
MYNSTTTIPQNETQKAYFSAVVTRKQFLLASMLHNKTFGLRVKPTNSEVNAFYTNSRALVMRRTWNNTISEQKPYETLRFPPYCLEEESDEH